jgi:hypothetical protein
MALRIWIVFTVLLAGCTTLDADEPPRELSYGCDDMVVIGRVATVAGTAIHEPEAALPNWRSEWRLQVHVKRVVRGSERRQVISATAISHAQIRDDRDFLIVLRPNEGRTYNLRVAALWHVRPRPMLTEPCS